MSAFFLFFKYLSIANFLFPSFSPFLSCPSLSLCLFRSLSTVGIFVWRGSLGQLMNSSGCTWLGSSCLTLGLSSMGLCGSLIKTWLWLLRPSQTYRGGQTMVIWPGSMMGSLCNSGRALGGGGSVHAMQCRGLIGKTKGGRIGGFTVDGQ